MFVPNSQKKFPTKRLTSHCVSNAKEYKKEQSAECVTMSHGRMCQISNYWYELEVSHLRVHFDDARLAPRTSFSQTSKSQKKELYFSTANGCNATNSNRINQIEKKKNNF